MTLVLLAVGLMATAVGLVTIGFGIPINAFSLGNTLIISGTIAVASGLILVGLALVLGQLRRIAEALKGGTPGLGLVESAESMLQPGPRVMPSPNYSPLSEPQATESSRAPEPRAPEPHAPEPRFPATASEPAPGPLDWLRAKSKPGTPASPAMPAPPVMVEPPMVELTDEAPLSPRPPQRPVMPPPPAEPSLEPKVWSPGRDAAAAESRPAPRPEPPMPRATPQVEPPKEKERFDLVWPDRGAAPAQGESKVETKREPALDMPLPPIPARPRETRPGADKRMPETLRKPPTERGPAILKSGVIDGMPYTLYADGSIEAQLPQGTVKFASVDALRAHLEKQS